MKIGHRASVTLAALAVAGSFGVAAWVVAEAPPAPSPAASAPGRSDPRGPEAPTTQPPPPPRERAPERSALASQLERATELARDLDPLAATFLEQTIDAAEKANDEGVAAGAREELERLREALRVQARETARWTSAEARQLARDGSPGGVGRFVEAIAAAHAACDSAAAKLLDQELASFRNDLRRREVQAAVERITAGTKEDDGSTDKDEKVREGFERLARGKATDFAALIMRLVHRAEKEHDAHECRLALRDFALARRAAEKASALIQGDTSFREDLEAGLAPREVRCRLEEGGRGVRRGDGAGARAFLDLADLMRLDGTASASPLVLYLLGRALEADGDADAARKHFYGAIGTATWLATDAPLDLVRWLARCRAVGRPISIKSPGAGPTWRRLPRARFTLFHELPGSAGSLAERVEKARSKALERLGFADPIRVQSFKPVVFVFGSEERYRESGAAPRTWAGGHAAFDTLQDGGACTLVVYDFPATAGFSLDAVLLHEWTHMLVDEHLGGSPLPSWATEGVATWTEPEDLRARRLEHAARMIRRGFHPWPEFLAAWRDPRYDAENAESASRFYSQSLVAFETVVRRKGSASAALVAAASLTSAGVEPFEALGFKDAEDFGGVVAEVVKPK